MKDSTPKRPFRKRAKYNLIYWFALALIKMANIFPRVWVLKFTGLLGKTAYYFFREAREATIRNLTRAFGQQKSATEIQKLAKEVFKMMGMNGGEVIRALPVVDIDKFKKIVTVQGEEHLKAAVAKNKGVIVITGHVGAFELVGSYVGLAGYKPLGIGTALKDEKLNSLLVHNRTSRGIEAIQRGKETFKLMKALKAGRVVIMLIDQDTRVKSRFVNFMGHPAATPIGGTLMAQRTGAAVVPIYISMQPGYKQVIQIYPEVDIVCTGDEEADLVRNTQSILNTTEKVILENPAQWVWMHERWKTQPGEEIV